MKAQIREVVRSYVLDRVRALTVGHDALFERSMRFYALLEQELHADAESRGERLRALATNPIARHLEGLLLGPRKGVVAAAIQGVLDNRQVMAEMDRRLAATASPSRAAIESLYAEVLTEVVPYERSLSNLTALIDGTRELHRLLTADGFVLATLRRQGYAFVRRALVRTDAARLELDALWAALAANPAELLTLASNLGQHGPAVIAAIYRREPEAPDRRS